jgi:hypothetical protein
LRCSRARGCTGAPIHSSRALARWPAISRGSRRPDRRSGAAHLFIPGDQLLRGADVLGGHPECNVPVPARVVEWRTVEKDCNGSIQPRVNYKSPVPLRACLVLTLLLASCSLVLWRPSRRHYTRSMGANCRRDRCATLLALVRNRSLVDARP